MRMFLIGMCDIFLILYLTSITNVGTQSVLTMDDFFHLKEMHEVLKEDKRKSEEALEKKLVQARLEKEAEAKRRKEVEKTLQSNKTERDAITRNLEQTEKMLKEREQTLDQLNSEIAAQQAEREKIEKSYQNELEMQKEAVEENRKLIDQMKQQTELATMAAEEAKTVQKLAVELKEQALAAKKTAEDKAAQALAKSYKAEVEKTKAISAMQEAKASRIKAEQNAERLATAIKDMTQDADVAYTNNVHPQMQTVKVTYSRKAGNDRLIYKRELFLLPVKIDGQIYLIFPSRQVGFYGRSDKAPEKIEMSHQGKVINRVLMHRDYDLVAIALADYKDQTSVPYPVNTPIGQLMPTLLALRNNGNVNLSDKARHIAGDYFIVKRDYLKKDKDFRIKYDVKGIRGTGVHGERIVQGDYLVDLNGRLIGVANKANRVIPVDTLAGWEEVQF